MAAAIVINSPARNTRINIDATPRMPSILCRAGITGVTPDPTPSTDFSWSAVITETVAHGGCASSRVGRCQLTLPAAAVRGGSWTPAFPSIQGGEVVITVSATVGGARLTATVNVQIRGTNPAPAAITARLGGAGTAADRIACNESHRRQFDGTGMPLLGTGGDVGIMQLCNPAATCGERWDWTANVAAGLALLAQKQTAATHHLNHHRVGVHYPNDAGLIDADVVLRETIQRYNGGAYWQWDQTHSQWHASPPNHYVAHVLACH